MKLLKTLVILPILALASCNNEDSTRVEPQPAETEATEVAAQPYPLDVCLVSGEELGSMGVPIVIVHEGQEIKFCCEECVPKFKENPEKYLSKLDSGTAE